MPFKKVQPEKLSTSVVRQIELLILRGILRPGERLPAERELAERLGVSRPSLRDAIAQLQGSGLLSAKGLTGTLLAFSQAGLVLLLVGAFGYEPLLLLLRAAMFTLVTTPTFTSCCMDHKQSCRRWWHAARL